MKRQQFRLASVLRYYVLQKQRSEFELQKAGRALRELEAEIQKLSDEIMAVSALVHGDSAARLRRGGVGCLLSPG